MTSTHTYSNMFCEPKLYAIRSNWNSYAKSVLKGALVIGFFTVLGCMPRVDNSMIQAALFHCSDKGGLQFIGSERVYCGDTSSWSRSEARASYQEHVKTEGVVSEMINVQ